MAEKNPFIEGFSSGSFGTFDDAIPLDVIFPKHFVPALQRAIDQARGKVKEIKNQPVPTFKNTIEALEISSGYIGIVQETFSNLYEANRNDSINAIVEEMQMMTTSYFDEVGLDNELFEHIKKIYDDDQSGLNPEQARLLEKTYKGFIRGWALLSSEDKEKFKKINEQLTVLYPKYSDNVLNATNSYELIIEDKEELAWLPETAIETAKEEAEKKGYTNKWLFTLQITSYLPFVTYLDNRALREKMVKASAKKATEWEFSNIEIIKQIISLRLQKAKLLWFKTHADFVLDNRMAKTLENVKAFSETLKENYFIHAKNDIEKLKTYAKEKDGIEDFQSRDVAYYEQKLKEELFSFNDEALRPYFKLENVIDWMFLVAKKLYGLTFHKRDDIPVYHQDVSVYEVTDENEQYMWLFYTDFFPRESKRAGAWMTVFRTQWLLNGKVRRPHVSIVCNFTKPTKEKPSLLTHYEVQTLFHEFGHGLHGLLSQCTYQSLGGLNVLWDFVELPSQLMEFRAKEKEWLDLFARHYETGDRIPEELLNKIKESENFMVAAMGIGQVRLSLIDMMRYGRTEDDVEDVMEEENRLLKDTTLVPQIPGYSRSASFSHIFSGGYDAWYYSYKWAELLAADAFEYFKENGMFNREIADKYKNNILTRGDTAEPMDLYIAFRGKEPDPKALLRIEGLA